MLGSALAGSACLHCASVYRGHFKADYGSRDDLVSAMKDDKTILDSFMEKRVENIEKCRKKAEKGTFTKERQRSATAAKSVDKKRTFEEALEPPPPDLLPWDEYEVRVPGHQPQTSPPVRHQNIALCFWF